MANAAPAALRGPFITFEGGDGAGKSTQIALLAERLTKAGHTVVVTREPGGSAGAEAVRALLVTGAADRWSPVAEALLVYAARADHLDRTVNPARARGEVVLCDRFSDSTMAYQGIAGDLGAEPVLTLERLVVGGDGPDLTLILDVPSGVGFSRAASRGGDSRFESKGADYQDRVRKAFLDIAARNPTRCAVVDASAAVAVVSAQIADIVRQRLGIG